MTKLLIFPGWAFAIMTLCMAGLAALFTILAGLQIGLAWAVDVFGLGIRPWLIVFPGIPLIVASAFFVLSAIVSIAMRLGLLPDDTDSPD